MRGPAMAGAPSGRNGMKPSKGTPYRASLHAALLIVCALLYAAPLLAEPAHGVHPLAGQGVNLGFGDAEALSAVLLERGPLTDAGAPILLERYARRRAEPVLAMHAVTDGLARLFGIASPWIRSARNLGMAGLERLPAAKRLLAQSALR